MHPYLGLRVLDSLPQGSLHWWFLTLQGMAASMGQVQLFRAFFMVTLKLNIFRISKIDASQLSCIVEIRFLDSPVLRTASDVPDQISAKNDQTLLLHEFVSAAPYSSGGFSSNIVNCATPVQGSDRFRPPSTFQQSSKRISSNTSNEVVVHLTTSKNRSGIGNHVCDLCCVAFLRRFKFRFFAWFQSSCFLLNVL